MFSSFTGNSRRPRNVNLSGQKTNPFAGTSWTPSPSGASSSIAQAQAERRQRQQERERIKAAQDIQRTWRGHRSRRHLGKVRRDLFDGLYSSDMSTDTRLRHERVVVAYPLLLSFFRLDRKDDCLRLVRFGQDLLVVDLRPTGQYLIPAPRLSRLAQLLITTIRRVSNQDQPAEIRTYLLALIRIIESVPSVIQALLSAYFDTLGCLFRNRDNAGLSDLLAQALEIPLRLGTGSAAQAYHELAWSFLTQPNLVLLENNLSVFASMIDTTRLAQAVLSRHLETVQTPGTLAILWLLAHFLGLQKAKKEPALLPIHLRALFVLLSATSSDLASFSSQPITAPETQLPQYVAHQVNSLVENAQISGLLERLMSAEASAEQFDMASLLAGYTLTLVRCFPAQGDEIRMRLYLADIPTPQGRIPSVTFFWNATSRTRLFKDIAAGEESITDILRRRTLHGDDTKGDIESIWEREWRTILLFLELYTFVLRLTDDEDFFGNINSSLSTTAGDIPRLRLCSLGLADLEKLTTFLKHLSFGLFYSASRLLINETTADNRNSTSARPPKVIPGFDLMALRQLASTTMRMLYERDSRRRFLPKDHWLMTSKFDMEGFQSAVVLEEQRQQELRDAEDEAEFSGEDDLMHVDSHANFTFAGQRRSRLAQQEQLRLRQKRNQRERMLAEIGPKLEILRNMPFVVPFDIRVQIFRQFVYLDKYKRREGFVDPDQWRMFANQRNDDLLNFRRPSRNRHHATIKRGRLFEDAMDQFYELGEGLKEPIQITFVDKFDQEEAGIDGGGVTKEFLTSITKEAFTDDQHFFVANANNSYYPNPCILDQTMDYLRAAGVKETDEEFQDQVGGLMRAYEFLGRIVGKCMYEGILIDIAFAGFFLLTWAAAGTDAGYRATVNDLREMDEELYQGMLRLKNYPGDVGELGLDFTIEDLVSLPGDPVRTITRNLVPNGADVPVTNENRPLYISYVTRHRLVAQPHAQTRAFLRGLGSIIQPSWLSMFNQSELQRLIGGDSSEIDVEDLRANTVYSGLYEIGDDGQEHPTIRLFWEVMRSLRDSERRDVLKYITSTPRSPLLGFGQLNPRFSIRDGGTDQERLPSASTCVNLLKLPQYKTAATLKSKLLYAVTSGAGFDLS